MDELPFLLVVLAEALVQEHAGAILFDCTSVGIKALPDADISNGLATIRGSPFLVETAIVTRNLEYMITSITCRETFVSGCVANHVNLLRKHMPLCENFFELCHIPLEGLALQLLFQLLTFGEVAHLAHELPRYRICLIIVLFVLVEPCFNGAYFVDVDLRVVDLVWKARSKHVRDP